MLVWFFTNAFKWTVRIVVTLVACASMQNILADRLGYRMEFSVLLIAAAITITTVRLWMPWSDNRRTLTHE